MTEATLPKSTEVVAYYVETDTNAIYVGAYIRAAILMRDRHFPGSRIVEQRIRHEWREVAS